MTGGDEVIHRSLVPMLDPFGEAITDAPGYAVASFTRRALSEIRTLARAVRERSAEMGERPVHITLDRTATRLTYAWAEPGSELGEEDRTAWNDWLALVEEVTDDMMARSIGDASWTLLERAGARSHEVHASVRVSCHDGRSHSLHVQPDDGNVYGTIVLASVLEGGMLGARTAEEARELFAELARESPDRALDRLETDNTLDGWLTPEDLIPLLQSERDGTRRGALSILPHLEGRDTGDDGL